MQFGWQVLPFQRVLSGQQLTLAGLQPRPPQLSSTFRPLVQRRMLVPLQVAAVPGVHSLQVVPLQPRPPQLLVDDVPLAAQVMSSPLTQKVPVFMPHLPPVQTPVRQVLAGQSPPQHSTAVLGQPLLSKLPFRQTRIPVVHLFEQLSVTPSSMSPSQSLSWLSHVSALILDAGTQAPLHSRWPAGHMPPQGWPGPTQLRGLSQTVPVVQVKSQRPPLQTARPPGGAVQAAHSAPQESTVSLGLQTPLQSRNPWLQR